MWCAVCHRALLTPSQALARCLRSASNRTLGSSSRVMLLRLQTRRSLTTNPSLIGASSTSSVFSGTHIPEAIQTIVADPSLKELGFNSYWPSDIFPRLIEVIHVHAELPWFASIFCAAFVIRLLMTPLMVVFRRTSAPLRELTVLGEELQHEMDVATNKRRSVELLKLGMEMTMLTRKQAGLYAKIAACSSAQMFVFVSMIRGVRRCTDEVPSFALGGLPWCQDLALADPYLILPTVICTSIGLLYRLNRSTSGGVGAQGLPPGLVDERSVSTFTDCDKHKLFIPLGALGFSLLSGMSAGTLMYVASSLSVSALQSSLLANPRVKRLADIPEPSPRLVPRHLIYTLDQQYTPPVPPHHTHDTWAGFRLRLGKFWAATKRRATSQAELKAQQSSRNNKQTSYLQTWERAGQGPVPVTYERNPLLAS